MYILNSSGGLAEHSCVQEVPSSNFDRITGCTDRGISTFTSFSPSKYLDITLKYALAISNQILMHSNRWLFSASHSTLCNIYSWNSIVK